jgi:starvation-inducible outer membrane lipoprotein
MNDREAFENYVTLNGKYPSNINKKISGEYKYPIIQAKWEAWQAALEAERQARKAMSEANDRMVWGD